VRVGTWRRGAQFPGRRIAIGVPNHCKGRLKVPTMSQVAYFLQYSASASERPHAGLTNGRQTCFFPRTPSNLVTPLNEWGCRLVPCFCARQRWSLQTWSRPRDESRDPFLLVSVPKVSGLDSVSIATGLDTFIIANKWYSKIYIIQLLFVCCICRWETTKRRRKNARNLKKFTSEVMTTCFSNSANRTNFEVSSL